MTPAEAAKQLEYEVSSIIFEINKKVLSRSIRAVRTMYNAALTTLNKDGTGRQYKRGMAKKGERTKKGRVRKGEEIFHIASAPGETPAPDTGNLRKNWLRQYLATSSGKGQGIRLKLRLLPLMHYAGYLEEGTSKMAARPYMELIKTKARPDVERIFSNI